jgi:caa(3)-type oxidase subunit IV
MSQSATAHDDHTGHHVLDLKVYFGIYGALLVLTALTVGVSYAGLGRFSIPVAMAVAVVKAMLVILFFMHLKYDVKLHSFVFFSSIIFVSIFFGLTFSDLAARGMQDREIDTFVYQNDMENMESYNAAIESEPSTEEEVSHEGEENAGSEH